jgi:hypothetical protein
MSSEAELTKLKVSELRALCKEKGLETTGVKAVLVSRLREDAEPSAAASEEEEDVAVTDDVASPSSTPAAEATGAADEAAPASSSSAAAAAPAATPAAPASPPKSAAETTALAGDADPVSVSKLLARKERFGQVEEGKAVHDPRLRTFSTPSAAQPPPHHRHSQ